MQNTISLREVLKTMRLLDEDKNPIPFCLTVRTFSRNDKSGGQIRTFKNATLLQPPKAPGKTRLADPTLFKKPNHFVNRTRNIKDETGISKINILFIISFNNLDVIY